MKDPGSEVSKLGTRYALESGLVTESHSLSRVKDAFWDIMDEDMEGLARHLASSDPWMAGFAKARLELGV